MCVGDVPVSFLQTPIYLESKPFPSQPHITHWLSTDRGGKQMRKNTPLTHIVGTVRPEQLEMQSYQGKTIHYCCTQRSASPLLLTSGQLY